MLCKCVDCKAKEKGCYIKNLKNEEKIINIFLN